MPSFFSLSHNSFYKIGYPWVMSIKKGLSAPRHCSLCGGRAQYPTGEISVLLEKGKGTKWPDVLGCGAYPLLIVSAKVIDSWRHVGVIPPVSEVGLCSPIPRRLEESASPAYFWVDGKKLCGASLDLETSGFVGTTACQQCGRIRYDISATYTLQHSRAFPYAFSPNSWAGTDLFTTQLSYSLFFCTAKLLDCARQFKLTNFSFIPVEQGGDPTSRGIEYIKAPRQK